MLITAAFHYVRPDYNLPYPGIFGVTPREFYDQLTTLSQFGTFISQSELLEAIHGNKILPERSWLITFDDGLREQYEHAWPVLKMMGIPAIFFINTAPIMEGKIALVHKIHLLRAHVAPSCLIQTVKEVAKDLGVQIDEINGYRAQHHYIYDTQEVARVKYLLNFGLAEYDRMIVIDRCFFDLLGWDEQEVSRQLYMDIGQIKELTEHGCIGSHTHHHLPLGLLDDETVRKEISMSHSTLTAWVDRNVNSISYPYGSRDACTPIVAKIAKDEGYELGFTMERAGLVDFKHQLSIPRCANNDLPGSSTARWQGQDIFSELPPSSWYEAV